MPDHKRPSPCTRGALCHENSSCQCPAFCAAGPSSEIRAHNLLVLIPGLGFGGFIESAPVQAAVLVLFGKVEAQVELHAGGGDLQCTSK